MVEICCGSFYDALMAYKGGAKRIELNSGLNLGGLTPSIGTLEIVKEKCNGIKIVSMVRPRGAGFCYCDEDFYVMERDCKELLKNGSDGIVFGCLNSDFTLDIYKNEKLIDLIHQYNGEAVFHRAFDCVQNPYETIEKLIDMGVDRILTSGLKEKAYDGRFLIKELQQKYGDDIEILAGSGINSNNAKEIMEFTGISQVHSSCKEWICDNTTKSENVSYSFGVGEYEMCYDAVSEKLVSELLKSLGEF